jgi:hypothetical protein
MRFLSFKTYVRWESEPVPLSTACPHKSIPTAKFCSEMRRNQKQISPQYTTDNTVNKVPYIFKLTLFQRFPASVGRKYFLFASLTYTWLRFFFRPSIHMTN